MNAQMARVHCQPQHRAKLLAWPSDSRQVTYHHRPSTTIWDFQDSELPGEEPWNGPLARSLAWGQTSGQAVLQQMSRLPGSQYFQQPPMVASVTVSPALGDSTAAASTTVVSHPLQLAAAVCDDILD